MLNNKLTDRLSNIVSNDKDLIFNFFIAFSRFEFALKEVGYRRKNRGIVQPDWDEFVTRFESIFDTQNQAIQEAYNYLDSFPPDIQIVNKLGELDWKDNQRIEGMSDLAWCVRIIKTVRNNLFHGGKFPYYPDRDGALMNNSMLCLEHFCELDAELGSKFLDVFFPFPGAEAPY